MGVDGGAEDHFLQLFGGEAGGELVVGSGGGGLLGGGLGGGSGDGGGHEQAKKEEAGHKQLEFIVLYRISFSLWFGGIHEGRD